MALLPAVVDKLRQVGIDDVLIVAGGIIPEQDIVALKEAGVHAVFTPGTPMQSIIDFIKDNVPLNKA